MGVVVVVGALVAGVEAGLRLGPSAAVPAAVAGVGGLALAWWATGPARVAVAAAALALLGCASAQRALDGLVHHGVPTGRVATAAGVVVADPQARPFRTDLLVRLSEPGRVVAVTATGPHAGRFAALTAGDRVVLDGWAAPLPRGAPERWRHAVAVVSDAELVALAPPRGLMAWAGQMRSVVVRGTRPLAPGTRALLLGFLLGDTRGVDHAVVDAYRAAGLSHLLAVSGANVAFVLALCGPLLRRLPLAARTATALAVVVVFAAMTRFEPSVLRASALAATATLATFAGRPQPSIRALGLAATVLLLVDPFLVRSVGFRLSCAASAGIVVGAPAIARRLPGPESVRAPLAVSLAAQAGVTPVLLATFGEVPLVAPVANLAAGPAAALVGTYGMVASLAGGVAAPLAVVLQPLDALALAWITGVARAASAVGLAADARVLGALAAVATLAAGARRALPDGASRRRGRRRADAGPGDGHPQPHARLVLRPGRDLASRRVRRPRR